MELLGFFVFWGLMCWGVSALAGARGRSSVGFFLLSFAFSPLLGLIVVLVMENLTEKALRESEKHKDDEQREHERKREHERQLESLRAITAAPPNNGPSRLVSPEMSMSVADELTKLAALREKGILTQPEFEAQKARLLGSRQDTNLANSFNPLSTAETPAAVTLYTVNECKTALVAAGCRVTNPSDSVWEVLDPSGVTRMVRSIEELQQLARRFLAA